MGQFLTSSFSKRPAQGKLIIEFANYVTITQSNIAVEVPVHQFPTLGLGKSMN